MALKLTLKPGERFVVNGAVIANGGRRSSLVIHNKVSILREKDIMQEEEATTPARRIYFALMLMYMDADNWGAYYEEFLVRMNEFMGVLETPSAKQDCVKVGKDVMSGRFYRAISTCKKLIAFEEERLTNVGESVPAESVND